MSFRQVLVRSERMTRAFLFNELQVATEVISVLGAYSQEKLSEKITERGGWKEEWAQEILVVVFMASSSAKLSQDDENIHQP